jgi:hypothetical protein
MRQQPKQLKNEIILPLVGVPEPKNGENAPAALTAFQKFKKALSGFTKPETKGRGVIRITPIDLLIKINDENPVIFAAKDITELKYELNEYEAEDKAQDLFTSRGRMSVRSGEHNFVYMKSNGNQYKFQFKLGNEFSMTRSKRFLDSLKQLTLEN